MSPIIAGCHAILRGNASLEVLSAVLFIPCIVTVILTIRTRRAGLCCTAVVLWLICVLVVPHRLVVNLLATPIWVGVTVLIRWVVRRIKKAFAKNHG